MHIWLVSIFEQTPVDQVFSTRFLSIAEEALSRGHTVRFVGSTFKHNTKNQRYAETTEISYQEGYTLFFVKSPSYQKNISLNRLLAHQTFSKSLVVELDALEDLPDVILMAFPPISVNYEVSKWAKRKGIPVVMDVIDPWPDTFSIALHAGIKMLDPLLMAPMRFKLKQTLKSLSGLTAISQQYIDWAQRYDDTQRKVEVLHPASDYSTIQGLIQSHSKNNNIRNTLNVIYAGSLASSYDIPCILDAAALLDGDYSDIHFYIAGAGPQATLIEKYQREHSNLTFLGRLPKEELMRYYAQSDLGLTQHVEGASQSVTYKLFDLLSAGLPILNSLESEMKDIILNNKVGLHNQPGDAEQLQDNILFFYHNRNALKEYREAGWSLTQKVGDIKVVYNNFINLLEEVAQEAKQINEANLTE